MILGHAYDPVIKAIKMRLEKGTSFGIPTALETEIATLALDMIANKDKNSFCEFWNRSLYECNSFSERVYK